MEERKQVSIRTTLGEGEKTSMKLPKFKRITDKKDVALVMIHGIIEMPKFFTFITDRLPEDLSYFAPNLLGHGSDSKSFGLGSAKRWTDQIDTLTDELLKKYKRIIFVGHSLGSLLSIHEANRIGDKAAAVILLNCPLKIKVTWKHMKTYLKVGLLRKKRTDDEAVNKAMENLGVCIPSNPLKYIYWAKPFLSLLKLIRRGRKEILDVTCRAYAFHSNEDELVSRKSLKCISRNPSIEIYRMDGSSHNDFTPEEITRILECLNDVIKSSSEFME